MAETPFRDFDAAAAEEAGDGLTFQLAGEQWTTLPDIPAGPVFDLAKLSDLDGADAFVAFRDFLAAVIVPDQSDAFLDATRNVGIRTMLAVVQWIVQETTARPFTLP